MRTVSEFTVSPGDRVPFVLTWFPSHEPLPDEIDPEQALADTEEYWLSWADRCTHAGDYHEEIHQSLLVLKALTYAPTGGIVAAPTTSLPELDRRRPQLGLPLLLAPRRDPDPAGDAARGLQRRGDGVARVAAARRGGRPGRRADHVRDRRRAPPRRVRARLAAGLRGLAAGARRQRRLDAAPARRLRGGARRALPGARARRAAERRGLVARTEAARVARRGVAARGRRDLGGSRTEPALHALQGHGLGRVRPRDPLPRGLRARRARRPLAQPPRRDPRRGHATRLERGEAGLHAVIRLDRARRERAADAARRLPARRPTRAWSRPSRRSGAS